MLSVKTKRAPALRVLLAMIIVILSAITPKVNVSAANEIANNGHNGIWIDINSSPYTDYANKSYGQFAYTDQGCAWFASARLYQLTGKGSSIRTGSAWYRNASSYGFTTGRQTPTGKALACYSSHVSVVEMVDGDNITISEGGNKDYPSNSYCVIRTVSKATIEGNSSFMGYVYLDGSNGAQQSGQSYNVFFTDLRAEGVSDCDAKIIGRVNTNTRIPKVGVVLYENGNTVWTYSENSGLNKNFDMWYNLKSEFRKLNPGTLYSFRFWAEVNGKKVYSDTYAFFTEQATKTSGVYLTNLRAENISSTGAKIIGRVNNPYGELVPSVGVELYNSDGNLIWSYSEPSNLRKSFDMWYTSSDFGTLNAGALYYYKFYAEVDGNRYYSDLNSFWTR